MRQILLNNAPPITVNAVVRSIPNQREVVRGTWNGQAIYAKIFMGKRAKTHIARDVAGVQLLDSKQIVTPTLLYQGLSYVGEVCGDTSSDLANLVVMYAAIEDAMNAEVAYVQTDTSSRFNLLTHLVKAIAAHHRAGIYQSDLHLKNFLVVENTNLVYTIDGDGIRALPRICKSRKMRQNLATFFSKLDVLDDVWIPELYRLYAEILGVKYKQADAQKLARQTLQIRIQIASEYADHKVFRNCTDVKLNRFSQTHTMFWCARAYAHLSELHNINAFNDCLKNPVFKAGNTCTVGLMNIQTTSRDDAPAISQQLVVKRYNIKSIIHALSRSLRTTRAAISWANAHRLMILGLPTATPIALIEKRYFFNMLKSQGYFVTSYIDAPDIALYFAQEKDKLKRAEVMREIATLFYKLYLLKLSHGDMKATNIKIYHDKPVLIDLDSMQQHRFSWIAKQNHARDLKRFMRNWQTDSVQDACVLAGFKKVFKVVYQDQTPLKLVGLI